MGAFILTGIVSYRSDSPPVPAVKNRLQVQQKQICTRKLEVYNNSRREKNTKADVQQKSFPPALPEAGRPPSSQFIPYVRTNEVYYLDPHAPVTRPSTHGPQYRQCNGTAVYCDLIHVEEMVQHLGLKFCALFHLLLLNFAITHFCQSAVQKTCATKTQSTNS